MTELTELPEGPFTRQQAEVVAFSIYQCCYRGLARGHISVWLSVMSVAWSGEPGTLSRMPVTG